MKMTTTKAVLKKNIPHLLQMYMLNLREIVFVLPVDGCKHEDVASNVDYD